MVNSFFYSNIAVPTTLSGNINNAVTSATVASTTGWPTSYPFIVAFDFGAANEELVQVTNNAAGTLTIVRGYGGTSAVSHSIGAVVRHTYNAQDATDFRTHEQATASVHGVTGALVGATQVQTLTNKTLTTPTINGATLSGTFTGTVSGSPVLNGIPVFEGATSTTDLWRGRVTADANPRFAVRADGRLAWGPGTTAADSLMFRDGANQLGLTDTLLRVYRGAASSAAYSALVTGDPNARFYIQADGKHFWGPGSATQDTTLYRFASGTLGTDGAFRAAGQLISVPSSTSVDGLDVDLPTSTVGDLLNLRVDGSIQAAMDASGQFRTYGGTSPTTYTPTWANGGSVTFTTNTGYWWRLGKIVFVNVFAVVNAAGSGSGTVSVTMPSNVDRSTRQALTVHAESLGAGGSGASAIRGGECMFFTGGSGAVADRIRVDQTAGNEGNILGNDMLAGGSITIQGWYREG